MFLQNWPQHVEVQAADSVLLGFSEVGGLKRLDRERPVDQPERTGVVRRKDLYRELFFLGVVELCSAAGAPVGESLLAAIFEVGAGAVRAPIPDLVAGRFFDAVDPPVRQRRFGYRG